MKVLVTVVPSARGESGRIEYSRPAEFRIIEEPSEVNLGAAICAFLDTFQNQTIRSHSVMLLPDEEKTPSVQGNFLRGGCAIDY